MRGLVRCRAVGARVTAAIAGVWGTAERRAALHSSAATLIKSFQPKILKPSNRSREPRKEYLQGLRLLERPGVIAPRGRGGWLRHHDESTAFEEELPALISLKLELKWIPPAKKPARQTMIPKLDHNTRLGLELRARQPTLNEQRQFVLDSGAIVYTSELVSMLLSWMAGDRLGPLRSQKPHPILPRQRFTNRTAVRNVLDVMYNCKGFRMHVAENLALPAEPMPEELPPFGGLVLGGLERSNFYFMWMHKGLTHRWLVPMRLRLAKEWLDCLDETGCPRMVAELNKPIEFQS